MPQQIGQPQALRHALLDVMHRPRAHRYWPDALMTTAPSASDRPDMRGYVGVAAHPHGDDQDLDAPTTSATFIARAQGRMAASPIVWVAAQVRNGDDVYVAIELTTPPVDALCSIQRTLAILG